MKQYIIKKYNNNNNDKNNFNLSEFPYLNNVADTFSYLPRNSTGRINLFDNIQETLNYIPLPQSNNKKSLLMIGKVQSGKTTHFSCFSAILIDIGYDFVFILGGTNTALLSQNINRVKESFKDEKLLVYTTENIKNINPVVIDKYLKLGYKFVFCIMKETTHLSNLIKVFEGSNLYNKSIAIIDDEGDLASLSNKETNKVINKYLDKLYNNIFNTAIYVSYTATPHGNFFIPKNNWQYPDFINLIHANDNLYCGLEVFHKPNSTKIKKADEEFITLKNAILEAVMKYLCVISKNTISNDLEMIVHSARINEDQDAIFDLVNNIVDEIIKTPYLELIENNYYLVKEYCERDILIDNYKKNIKCLLSCIKVFKLYGESNKKNDSKYLDFPRLNIYVGGDMLGRGVSFFPIVSYVTRTSKIFFMDTLLQRARWFGYRKNSLIFNKYSIFDMMSVYLEDRIKTAFETIRKSENSIWKTVDYIVNNGIDPKKINLIIVSNDQDLLPTNKDKLGKNTTFTTLKDKVEFIFSSINNNYYDKIVGVEELTYSLDLEKEQLNNIIEFIAITSYLEIDNVSINNSGIINIKLSEDLYLYGK